MVSEKLSNLEVMTKANVYWDGKVPSRSRSRPTASMTSAPTAWPSTCATTIRTNPY